MTLIVDHISVSHGHHVTLGYRDVYTTNGTILQGQWPYHFWKPYDVTVYIIVPTVNSMTNVIFKFDNITHQFFLAIIYFSIVLHNLTITDLAFLLCADYYVVGQY